MYSTSNYKSDWRDNLGFANRKILHTDILIIGGGTAGCYAALTVREHSDYSIIIAEKANIKRSGCLAAGVHAINAYIVKGRQPEDYVDYCWTDADGIVREDLLLSKEEQEAVESMRRALNGLRPEEAVDNILNMFSRTRNNEELIQMVKKTKFI